MKDGRSVRRDDLTIRVLIAERDDSFREELKRRLMTLEWVHLVGETGNGSEAVELAEDLHPNVMIVGQNIPGISGITVTRQIKAERPKIQVFFLAEDAAMRDEALSAGATDFFVKGKTFKALVEAVQKAQAQRRWPTRAPEVKPPSGVRWGNPHMWKVAAVVIGLTFLGSLILIPGISLPMIALVCGLLFFIYGLKYYGSVALILAATSGIGKENGNGNGFNGVFNGFGATNGIKNGLDIPKPGLVKSIVERILGREPNGVTNGLHSEAAKSLNNNGSSVNGFKIKSSEQPFVSIHLPLYNETRVVDRLLEACTRLDYKNYEILIADDSTDETLHHLERWAKHPKVRVSHRINRTGFKGAALKHAMEVMDPRTQFIAVFDADFIPPPTILHQFLSYFYNGNGHNGNNRSTNGDLELVDESLAVVQGYQWHVLNASENWITRGIRTEFSGSYVVERPSQELTGGMKMISGSVFMIRADLLRNLGWGTSITEDWELTIRLYLEGYRVLFSPFIQAPAECVADFKQLARQRMRWSEGHTFNVKKYFFPLLRSKKLTRREKLEFLYYAPYYLQSIFFIFGTLAWFISEIIFRNHLPFWTATLGWSLVFTNTFALILMNTAGLFLERGIKRNLAGLLSFVLLTFLLVPYQAYSSLKGLLEPHEGGWHRTDKTGVITDVIDKLGMGRRMRRLMPKKKKRPKVDLEKRLGLPLAKVWRRLPKPVRNVLGRAGQVLRPASGIAFGLLILAILIAGISQVEAGVGDPQNVFYFHNAPNSNGHMMSLTEPAGISTGTSESKSFFSDIWQEGYRVPSGNSTVYLWLSSKEMVGEQMLELSLSSGSEGGGWTTLGSTTWAVNTGGEKQFLSASFFTEAYDLASDERLRLDVEMPSGGGLFIHWDGNFNRTRLETPTNAISLWSLTAFPAAPLMVYMTSWVLKRRRLALRLVSILLACCVTLGFLAIHVPSAGAMPSYDVGTGTTFWFYDDTSPLQYMMYQSQPSGSDTSAGGTLVNFYSDTWPAGFQVNAGTSTVYFYVQTTGVKRIDFELFAGSGSTWTSLGSGNWSGNQGSIALLSTSFSTNGYTFSTGERLRLDADIGNGATMYWDGSYNDSRLVTPTIVVPEGAIGLVAVVVLIPLLVGAKKRRKAKRTGASDLCRKDK